MSFNLKWIKIERDNFGIATMSSMNIMFAHLPFVLLTQYNNKKDYNIITKDNFNDYYLSIQTDIKKTHYLRIPDIK